MEHRRGLITVVALAALFAPLLALDDPIKSRPAEALSPPSLAHPFGTDQYVRDILNRARESSRCVAFDTPPSLDSPPGVT